MYNESGDFDAVIEQYNADEESADEEETETTDPTATEETADSTTTTADTTTTTTADTTMTDTDATTTTTGSSDESSSDEEETDPNLHDVDANLYGDEDFTNAIKSVPIGQAQIVEYKAGGTKNTAALILRLDPEEGKTGIPIMRTTGKTSFMG